MAIKFLSGLNLSNVTAGSILKLDSNGNIVAAVDGTDYNTGSVDSWSASGSDIYRNSDVRIGTYQSGVAPSARLHVFDYQTTDPKLLIEDGNTGDASMQFKISTQSYTMGIDNSDSDKFIIANAAGFNLAANTHALEISTNGKITVPAHSSSGSIRLELGGYNRLRFNGGIDLLGYGSDHLWVIGNSTTNTINLGADWDWDKQVAISYTPNTVGTAGGVMILGQTEKNNANWTHGTTKLYTNGTERLRIDSNGNVGIGTTSPDEKLSVVGNTGLYGTVSGGIVSPASLRFFTSEDGAGLGDSTDSNKQKIGQITWAGKDTSLNATGEYAAIRTYLIDSNNLIQGSANEGGQIEFSILRHDVGANPRVEYTAMTINNSANVGIGTSTPSTKLHVSGGNILVDAQYGIRFVDANTRIYTNSDSPEDLIVEADQNLHLNPDGSILAQSNISMEGGSIITTDSNNALVLRSDVQHDQGSTDAVISFKQSTTEHAKIDQDGYLYASGFKVGTGSGVLRADGSTETITFGTMASASTGDYKDSDAVETYVGLELASYTLTSAFGSNAFTSYTDHSTQGYLTSYTETDTLDSVTGRGATTTNNISVGNLTAVGGTFTDPVTIYDSTTTENPRLSVGRNAGESIQFGVTDVVNTITAKQDSDSDGDHFFVLDRVFAGTGDSIFRIHNDGTPDLTIDGSGVVSFNQYNTAGILKVNTSGTISVDTSSYLTSESDTLSSVVGRGASTTTTINTGDILPSADSTYDIGSNANKFAEGHFDHLYIGETGNNPRIDIYTEGSSAAIADTFTDTTTDKSYIYFQAGTSSNDPAYIMHETSNGTSPDERNEGVLHLVPSDDNSTGDYVSIHGTNDADVLKLHTSGLIETATGYQLVLKSGNAATKVDDTLHVTGRLYVDTLDANTTSTSALVEGASGEIEKRTLGSAAFSTATDFVAVGGDTVTGQITFPTAIGNRPVFGEGIIARSDQGDTDGTHDIWGISERYYPSNSTDADAWGIQWSGTPNEINFIGAGQKKLSIDLDTAGTVKIDGNAVATESYVGTAISNLVDSAPAALDTLNELAAALGDDASFSTTMSTALGNRLRIDVNNQSLSSTELSNARTNLGLGTAATSAATDFVAVSGDTMTGNLTMSSATPTLKFSINGAENNAGIVWEDGDAGDPSAQAAAIKWDASSNHMRFYNNDEAAERMRINSDGTTTFLGTINASAGIGGLTLANGGISGTNYNITGVNQLEIADPGEGIVFKSGSSGDMTLAIVDDTADNILRFSGTNATFDVAGNLSSTSLTIADSIIHEGDTNTSISFGTDTINFNTGGGARAIINDSGAKFNNNTIIAGGSTLSLGERAEGDDNGRTVLIEGVADASSGEGSGRIFFTEHNSTDAAADKYGLSLYYEGNPNAQLPSGFQPNTGNATWSLRRHDNSVNGAAIMSGTRSSNNVTFSGTVTVAGRLYATTVDANATSTTALVLGASNEIEKRTLGTNAFNSTAYLEDISPATPSVSSATVVGETIEITFAQSSTPDVDYYQVWSAVGSGGSYGMIAHVPQEDVASSMTVIDATFDVSDTIYYRVYAVKSGIYSTAGTINKAFSSAALDVSNMSVVNLNTAYYIQYEMPDSRFVDHVEIYMDAEASAANLTRTGATLVYSGNNTSYMYKIGANDLDKYHQFWVEVVES